ncbi:hypothetical protein BofuT4_uP012170.1 [Botrytis cinerea T4]|uniref:Uncharacterized protein n=1 Tax=Botryotinia fuckeliana (strain T4) TaxID=999810 RepID=G2XSA4_BOTF4|nr:hypothetical protein BofuT4_uP012170.1 [Botrytis cinerea T4]
MQIWRSAVVPGFVGDYYRLCQGFINNIADEFLLCVYCKRLLTSPVKIELYCF